MYVAQQNISAGYTILETCVYSIAVPLGFTMTLCIMSAIRQRLEASDIPTSFKGNPIAMIVAALMAIAMSGLGGIV